MPTSIDAFTDAKPRAADLALLLLLSTLWGASYTFIRVGVQTIPPLTLMAARMIIAGALLFAWAAATRVPLPRDRQTWRHFFAQAVFSCALPFALIAWAEQTVPAGLATILNSTTPIFAFGLTWLVTRHEAVSRRKLFGVVAGLAGVCLIVGADALAGVGRNLLPQLAVLVASACYGWAAILGQRFNALSPVAAAAGAMACGALMLAPASVAIERPWDLQVSASSLSALLGLSVFSTALAFVVYFRLMRRLGSVGTTSQAFLRVPIGVGIGVAFLGETLNTTAWIGLACVVVGVAAMTLPRRERRCATAAPSHPEAST